MSAQDISQSASAATASPLLRVQVYFLKVDPNEVVRLYRDGYTLSEVGKALGCSHVWAWKVLKSLGEPTRSRARRTAARAA